MQWRIKCVGISDHGAMKTVEFFSEDLRTKLYVAVEAANKTYQLGHEYGLNVALLSDVENSVESVDKPQKKK
jgi:hypothetical protein